MPAKRRTFWARLNRWWLRYEYKHTTLAVMAVILFVSLFDSALLGTAFSYLQGLGYIGGFLAGVLSTTFFTAVPAVVLIVELATAGHDPLFLALIVGLGSAAGDMLLLVFFEEKIFYELRPIFKRLRLSFLLHDKRKRASVSKLLAGALIIMTPLPDEIGLGLLGISRFPKAFIFVICLALNTLGAALVILAVRAVAA
ncbi:MAG TPA: hypothetical protein VFO38_06540 [Candidatus Saccharimonadales bacterium]|nr:hypothetical protein [Candidatus Saccharimonadales bacterium]